MKLLLPILLLALRVSSPAQSPPGQYPFTSTRAVTSADLDGKDLAELKIMRNEVFARHGHTFKGEDLKTHFGSQAWYKASVADATPLLSELEKQNVDFIKKWETRIASTGNFKDFYALFVKAVNEEDEVKLAELAIPGGGMFESIESFKGKFMSDRADIQTAIEKKSPGGDDTRKSLRYGEFYQGVQYKWVEFHKVGCCWYIYGFGMAG